MRHDVVGCHDAVAVCVRDAVQRGIYDMVIAKGSANHTVVEVLIVPKEPRPRKKTHKERS